MAQEKKKIKKSTTSKIVFLKRQDGNGKQINKI